MADFWVQLLHQQPLLLLRQRLGALEQFTLQQPLKLPLLWIAEPKEMQISGGHKVPKPPEVVTGLLRVQIHVRKVGVVSGIDGPTGFMALAQAVVRRQIPQQGASQAQPLFAVAGAEQAKGALHPMDLPAACIGIKK